MVQDVIEFTERILIIFVVILDTRRHVVIERSRGVNVAPPSANKSMVF